MSGNMNRVRTIGQGGLGVVSLWQTTDGRLYAVKQMQYTWDNTHYQRFKREIEILASLVHKNIIKIINYDILNNNPWYVMPYFKDGSLRDKLYNLQSQGQMYSEKAASSLIYYLADALSYAHSKNIIHRDLKPENILFDGHEPVVADWGIGKFIHRESQVLTIAGLGTKTYCSPEQWHSGESDPRSDIYSLGMIYRELVTNSVYGQVNNTLLNNVINRMTMPSPSDRYQSMEQVKQAIISLHMVNTADPMQAFWEGAAKIAVGIGIIYLLANLLDSK